MFSDQVASSWNAVNARNYSSLAALVFTLTEYALTIRSEHKYIWKWRASLWSPKGLYLVARYFGIIIQIVNYSLVQIYLTRGPVHPDLCRTWFILLVSCTSVLFVVLDAVLLLRVYALYRKNTKIYYIVVPLVLQYLMPTFMVRKNAYRNQSFNSHCDINDTPMEVGFSGAFCLLAHVPLWLATFWKRHEADCAEVARVVIHEGGWGFGLFTFYMGGILSYCVVIRAGNPFAIFVLPSVAFSMASCRMIIRMRALNPATMERRNMFNSSSSIAFTTFINSRFTVEEVQVDEPKEGDKSQKEPKEKDELQKEDESKKDEKTEEGEQKGDEQVKEDEQKEQEEPKEQNDPKEQDEVKKDEPKEDEPQEYEPNHELKDDEPQEYESNHKLNDDEPKEQDEVKEDEPKEDDPQEYELRHNLKDDEPNDETQKFPAGDGSP